MRLYIFDKDNTLMSSQPGRPANTPEEQQPLPGVVETLAGLREAGGLITCASNQGGVAHGHLSLAQALRLMVDCSAKVGRLDAWRMCIYSPNAPPGPLARDHRWRKPQPGMLISLMYQFKIPAHAVLFVGDQDTDQQAAAAAGVAFAWAWDFFGWPAPIPGGAA